MRITASMVKELRERTGAGMMECKKALTETNGDMEAAIELMRKSGQAKADKKAGRIAAEGVIVISAADDNTQAAVVEINCETDFVAKDNDLQTFATAVAEQVLVQAPADVTALSQLTPTAGDGQSVEQSRQALVSKIGENIQIRRFENVVSRGGHLGRYLHGYRIGVLVDMKGGDAVLAKDVAMHIAASRPLCVAQEDVPAEIIDKEREILTAQAQSSNKPAEIIEKMVQGRLHKYLAEVTLLGQPFVKDPDTTVGKLLKKSNAECLGFIRYEVGEGIAKKTENFADEVMAQVKGA